MFATGHSDPLIEHYDTAIKSLAEGEVVPFLGAGVNRCGRPDGFEWDFKQDQYLPDAKELATHLAGAYGYPGTTKDDLVRVSQFVAVMQGPGALHRRLRILLDRDYQITAVHTFLATLPDILRKKGAANGHQLILTTNYDDVLERAFRKHGEPFDLVTYEAEGEFRGKFIHYPPDGKARPINKPNKYEDVSIEERSVILKVHGCVERRHGVDGDGSYVITEDDYIDYLARSDPAELIPKRLLRILRNSHLLFLGYGLQDWNLRVMLHRIAQDDGRLKWKGWAIQLNPDNLDQKFWDQRNVDIFNVRLETYIAELSARLK